MLGGLLASGVAATLASPISPMALTFEQCRPQLLSLRETAVGKLQQLLKSGQLARDDGFIYTIDAAQLFICFARAADRASYEQLREHCVKHLIQDNPMDPFTRGFVAWRYKPGAPLDATGTTESLRVAKALWIGSKTLGDAEGKALARTILHGYNQHSTTDQDTWIIRNYFSFQSRSFATNSYLVDYDPDFVREVADGSADAKLNMLADNCINLVRHAIAPSGLIYDLVQPELRTLYPLLNISAFSPNDVIGLSNSTTVALCSTQTAPEVARGVLNFALGRISQSTSGLSDLRRYYFGHSGSPVDDARAGYFEHCTLCRLASNMGERNWSARLLEACLPVWQSLIPRAKREHLFILTEITQAIDDLLQ